MTDNQIAARDAALAALPEGYDVNEGSVFWNIVSALAIPCGDMLDTIDKAIEQKDPANLEGDELELFVNRYGLTRHLGAAAETTLVITLEEPATAADIPGGTLFETENGLQFAADYDFLSVQNGTTITVTAIDNGEAYNVGAGEISVVPIAIEGVESVTNPDAAAGGMDTESDGELFERWQVQVGYIQTGYNKAWYEAKALGIDPVGYAKCYAAGEVVGDSTVPANYVYVIVLDDGNQPLDEESLAIAQKTLDPDVGGVGDGVAPPTAHCQVINGETLDVSITVSSLKIDSTYAAQEVKDSVEDLIQQALGSMPPGDTIYFGQVMSNIMAAEGVIDAGGVQINGAAESLCLGYNQVPSLQGVTYGTVTAV